MSGTLGQFQDCCKELGAIIAKNSHGLIVQFDKDSDADGNIANGYVDWLQKHPRTASHHIEVVRPLLTSSRPFASMAEASQGLFSDLTFPSMKWDSARFRGSCTADATIAVGGGARTEMTGYVTLAAQRTLVPIAAFGGAAESLLYEVTEGKGPYPALPTELSRQILSQACESSLEAIDRWLARATQPRIVLVHGRDEASLNELITLLTTELKVVIPDVMKLTRMQGLTLPEKWERLAREADGAIVLATPDDQGGARDASDAGQVLSPRTRQNVWLEMGWFWGYFQDRGRLLLLLKGEGSGLPELPSDALGIEYYSFKASVREQISVVRDFVQSLTALGPVHNASRS